MRTGRFDGITFLALAGTMILAVVWGVFILQLLSGTAKFMMSSSWASVWGSDWDPSRSRFGFLPMVFGTLTVGILGTLFTAAVGLPAAYALSELLPLGLRKVGKFTIEGLALVPSVVYGLLGLLLLGPLVKGLFGLQDGNTLFTAAVLLGVMALPLFITLTDDQFQSVRQSQRLAARSLGFARLETFIVQVLPRVKHGVAGALLLSFGRIVGETIAVMMVVGSVDKLPQPFYNILSPGQTITSRLGRSLAETSPGGVEWYALLAASMLLLLINIALVPAMMRTRRAL